MSVNGPLQNHRENLRTALDNHRGQIRIGLLQLDFKFTRRGERSDELRIIRGGCDCRSTNGSGRLIITERAGEFVRV